MWHADYQFMNEQSLFISNLERALLKIGVIVSGSQTIFCIVIDAAGMTHEFLIQ